MGWGGHDKLVNRLILLPTSHLFVLSDRVNLLCLKGRTIRKLMGGGGGPKKILR